MNGLTILPAAGRRLQAWKNGGGSTSEIAAFPPGAGLDAFEWRVSMAAVPQPGRFSRFEGVERTLAVLSGQLELTFDGEGRTTRLTPESSPFGFAGEAAVNGTPIDGPVVDFNLMTRRGCWTGAMERYTRAAPVVVRSPVTLLLFTEAGQVRWRERTVAMEPFDAVQLDTCEGDVVALHSDADVYVVHLGPLQSSSPR
jgi:uncharacterized protein